MTSGTRAARVGVGDGVGAQAGRALASSAPVGAAAPGVLAVVAAALLWGTTGTAATFAPEVGPLAVGAVAMGAGGLLQAGTAWRQVRRHRDTLSEHRALIALGGLAVAVYPLAFYSSMHLAGVAVGTVVSLGSAPLASAVVERVVDRRTLSRRWLVAAGTGLVGIVLICAATALGGVDGGAAGVSPGPGGGSPGSGVGSAGSGVGSAGSVAGVLLGLVAGATYALYSWVAHRLMRRGVPSRAAMGAVFGTGGVALLPVLAVTGGPLLASAGNAAVGAYMALVPMFCGYVLFGWGLARVPASTATTLTLLEPAVAAVLAVLVVGERLPGAGWVGVGLVVASLVVLAAPGSARRPGSGSRPERRRRGRRLLPWTS